jgi:hypothetical protein
MPKFTVCVELTVSREVVLEAETAEAASDQVADMFHATNTVNGRPVDDTLYVNCVHVFDENDEEIIFE